LNCSGLYFPYRYTRPPLVLSRGPAWPFQDRVWYDEIMANAKIPPEALAFFVKAGRKGGKIGGKKRVANMTPEQLSEANRKAVQARWAKAKGDKAKIIMERGPMKTFSEFVSTPESEGLFEMANLSPKRTGLPFVVWISPKAGVPHDVRVKISKGPKVNPTELISVAIRPDVHVVGSGNVDALDLALLKKWLALNQEVIIKYWDGEIEYTEDAIAALKPLM